MKITATIIAFNEESNIRAACESVGWTDEIIVVDSQSTDCTREIATAMGAHVIIHQWPGFAGQKQFAVEQAKQEWILSLDADERVSDELRSAIVSLKSGSESDLADGYLMARRTYYQGRWIRGGGWYPDRQLRLFRKTLGAWNERLIHESVEIKAGARTATLAGDILHYTESNAAYHHRMIGERYAPLAAR